MDGTHGRADTLLGTVGVALVATADTLAPRPPNRS